MRLFAIVCFAVALYYGYTAVETMITGIAYPLRGDSGGQLRNEPSSLYYKFLLARWLMTVGFAAVGVVMNVFASRFEKLGEDAKR